MTPAREGAPPGTGAGGGPRERDRRRLRALVARPPALRAVVLAAHPDDETIGASRVLQALPDPLVVFLTDGAPRDHRFWPAEAGPTRLAYAARRRSEARRALGEAGLPPDRIRWLDVEDQRAAFELVALTEAVAGLLRATRPDVLLTVPYEGGHPDHDAAAFVAQLAVRLPSDHRPRDGGSGVEAGPTRIEMTSYHARGGALETGGFLAAGAAGADVLTLALSEDERARKARMVAAYASQQAVLAAFALDRESLRVAPEYDFRAPPHPGPLWYERLGWPLPGARWRALAAAALDALAARGP